MLGMATNGAMRRLAVWALPVLAIAAAGGPATAERTAPDAADLVGQVYAYEVKPEETLLDIARRYKLGYTEIRAANPEVDPWVPDEGSTVLLPTAYVIPDAPRRGVVINLAEQRLYLFSDPDQPPESFPLGIGRDGLNTPLGATKVTRKTVGPTWRPTARMRRENPELPAVVGPGPDNPLGSHAIYLGWPQYLIHGTNRPWGIGRRVSSGCIRLYPEDIVALYPRVPVGTPVTVVDQPIKFGWFEGELYMEAHTSQAQADQMEAEGEFTREDVPDLVLTVLDRAGDASERVDWQAVHTAVYERSGVPVRVTVPEGAVPAMAAVEGDPAGPGRTAPPGTGAAEGLGASAAAESAPLSLLSAPTDAPAAAAGLAATVPAGPPPGTMTPSATRVPAGAAWTAPPPDAPAAPPTPTRRSTGTPQPPAADPAVASRAAVSAAPLGTTPVQDVPVQTTPTATAPAQPVARRATVTPPPSSVQGQPASTGGFLGEISADSLSAFRERLADQPAPQPTPAPASSGGGLRFQDE